MRTLLAFVFSLGCAFAQPQLDSATLEELERMSKLMDKKRVYTPHLGEKKRINPFFRINRDDRRIIDAHISTNDSVEAFICFGNPLRIHFANDREEKFSSVGMSDNQMYLSGAVSEDRRSAVISVQSPLPKDKFWRGSATLVRESDGESYKVFLTATYCPLNMDDYPSEIRIHKRGGKRTVGQPFMNPADFITEITKGRERVNAHKVEANIMVATSGVNKIAQPLTIMPSGGVKRDAFNFKLVYLDSLQIQQIPSQTQYLKWASKRASRKAGRPVIRLNSHISVGKKYIWEREYVYLLLIDLDRDTYQHIKIPLKSQYMKLQKMGFELD